MDFLLYWFVVILSHILARMPLGLALAFGRAIGRFTYRVPRLRRRVVLANLRHVLGDGRSEAELRAIALATYESFGMFLVEVFRCCVVDLKLDANRPFTRDDIGEYERLRDMKTKKQPLIICTPHAANYDLGCYVFGLEGLGINIVMKPLESERFHRMVRSTRERYGNRMIMKQGDVMSELVALLRAGEWVGLLPDQNAKARGVTVDFLGKPASIYKGAAILHLDTGAPIAVLVGERSTENPRRHFVRTTFLPPVTPGADREADIKRIMQSVANAMSDVILRHPEQYFWFHRLWGKKVAAA